MVIKGWVIAGALAIWAIFVIVFMFRINIVEGVELERFAEKNNFRLDTVAAERGNLYASNGALMATTVTKHNIFVDLSVVKDELFNTEMHNLADS